jgi:hypothetical protein
LVGLAKQYQTNGQLADIIDQSLATEIKPDFLRKFGEIAEECSTDRGADRPAMLDILSSLKCALQLQKDVVQRDPLEYGHPREFDCLVQVIILVPHFLL